MGSALGGKLRAVLDELDLDLAGRVVLTEAATGPYVVTALLAALAGAEVFAFAKDTAYGTAERAIDATRSAGSGLDLRHEVTYLTELAPEVVAAADVITNSGQLRPLDESLLRHAKDSVVLPLMYEAWEWREGDLDLAYARRRGMTVGATNERHPGVDVFGYLGDMAVKQVFDAGTTPYRNRFVLVANNDFGPYIARVLGRVCAGLAVVAPDEQRNSYADLPGVDWVGGFPQVRLPAAYRAAEAVVFTAYPFDRTWIGHGAPIDVAGLAASLDHPLVLRYAGDVDVPALEAHGVRCFPAVVPSGHMGVLPSAVGFDPVIRLQAGGLKSAEAMLTGRHEHAGVPVVELL
ncbi:hypothetical protein [Phycicoccus ginsengisoli]